MANDFKCKVDLTPPRHYWHWGDTKRPEQKEPDPDAKCQCGQTTWAAEKIKHGIPV